MNLLLCKFNDTDNYNFKQILEYYQKYFIFKNIENETFIYLDTEVLKEYLKNGIEIRHRNYIFLYLKYQKNILNNKNDLQNNNEIKHKFYKIKNNNFQKNNILLNSNINIKFKNIYKYYSKNIEYIFNKIEKIYNNKNNFNIKDPNIIKLDNSFYANIKNERFYFCKIQEKNYKYKGIILNNNLNINNIILSILSISSLSKFKTTNSLYKSYFDTETQKKEKLQFNTKCNLIITQKENINLWKNILNKYYPDLEVKTFSKKKKDNLTNKDILNTDFLIINNSITKLYSNNNINITITNNFDKNYSIIENSLYDSFLNENLENSDFNNVFIFNWNNIIFDSFEKIIKIDKNNLIYYLTCSLNKYFLTNINIDQKYLNYLIKSGIIINDYNQNFETYKNNLYLNKINFYQNYKTLNDEEYDLNFDFDFFYKIINNELIIKSYESNPDLISNILINLELSEFEKELYSNLFDGIDNTNKNKHDNISRYLIDVDKYNFIEEDFKNIKNKENNENKYTNNYFNEVINNYDENDKNNICSICIEKIENPNNFSILLCGHYFCKSCIRKYIFKNIEIHQCPVCRKEFEIKDIICPKNNSEKIKSTKINKIFEIIDNELECINAINNDNDFDNNFSIMIVSYLDENINNLKNIIDKYPKNLIIITNYQNILKYPMNNIKAFIFIDFPNNSEESKIKEIDIIENKVLENYIIDNNTNNINNYLIKKNFYHLITNNFI